MPAKKYNTLVISDLHLGEDLSLSATEATTRNLATLERQLIAFIRHYTQRRHDGLPWRLVINGDMVDFLTICLLPGDKRVGETARRISAEERTYGLGRRENVAAAKMAAVVGRHEDVFRAMGRFAASGNRIEIICGNHDAELHWERVQAAMVDGIVELWTTSEAARRPGAAQGTEIASRIGFHPWFFYEKGVAWIEHGHQYDECASFNHALAPMAEDGEHLASNVDAAGLRYVTNRIDDAEPHSLQEWNFVGYMQFALSLGIRGIAGIAKGYMLFAASLIATWRSYHPRSKEQRTLSQRHSERLLELARSWDLDPNTLSGIDDLRRRPVVNNLRRLMGVLMLDRLLINIVAIVAAVATVLSLPLLTGLLIALAILLSSRLVGTWIQRGRQVNPEASVALVSERILSHVDAPFLVLGHTHEPIAQKIDGDRMYYNGGTWMPSGKPGLLRCFTHVMIRHSEYGPMSGLYQWRDGASRDFTPGWAPLAKPATQAVPSAAAEPVRAHAA